MSESTNDQKNEAEEPEEEQGSAQLKGEEEEETPEEKAQREADEAEAAERKAEADASAGRSKRAFRVFIGNALNFLRHTLSLKEGVDREGTLEGIERDVDFRGHAAWILVFSVLIASIGLSVGNVAVIIGAMLISPLMGPILGIGLAAGTNDLPLLKRSMANLLIAIVISVLISALYFLIIPMPEINLELQDRKQATLLAIAIALFGGAAGIIAGSRRYKSNVVPGVAIATALMPPLCTVGFGLATAQWDYFFGASYLFFINSVFIALPTYFYIRYMRFPVKKFIDPKRERRIRWRISIFLIITVVPSAFIFYDVLQKSFFSGRAQGFLQEVEASLVDKRTTLISERIIFDADTPSIKIALMGDPISPELRSYWKDLQVEYDLEKCNIDIREPRDFSNEIEELRAQSRELSDGKVKEFYLQQIEERNATLDSLQQLLSSYREGGQQLDEIAAELKMLFPRVERAAFAYLEETDFTNGTDTIPTLLVQWTADLQVADRNDQEEQLSMWLKVRLRNEEARVMHYGDYTE